MNRRFVKKLHWKEADDRPRKHRIRTYQRFRLRERFRARWIQRLMIPSSMYNTTVRLERNQHQPPQDQKRNR